jgi:predicted permease
MKGLAMVTLIQDLRFSVRQLLKSPGFALTAIVSLALGIGATSAVFSVIYAVLINPYPYPAADRIVRLMAPSPSNQTAWAELNGPQVQQMRKASFVDAVLAMDFHAVILTGKELPENVDVVGLIGNGFSDLGLPPMLGRGILPSDAIDGQEPQAVAVLSYKFWQKQYFADPNVVGETLQLDHKSYTIVGVAAPRFIWYSGDVYLPLKLTQEQNLTFVTNVRLKPGVTHATADAALQPLFEQFAKETPKHFPEHFRARVEGLNEWVIRGMQGTLYLVFAGVGLLLAIGCGNVSILLLARGAAREHEFAVRAAIGAHRGRMLRQLLTESLLLASVGAGLGVALSYGILAAFRVLLQRGAFAPEVVIGINMPVLAFSVCVGLATGAVFGLWPALQLSRTQVGQMMQSNARRVAGSVRGRRMHDALIATQIAMTLVLLVGAGSAIQGFSRLIHKPLGYDPHNVMSVGIPLRENSYSTWEARRAYLELLGAKVAEVPGVRMTAISLNATPPYGGWTTRMEILGQPASEDQMASICFASPEYFPVLRIPVLEGRLWNESENHRGAAVAVVNRTLAQRYFPKGDAIGHSVRVPAAANQPPTTLTTPDLEKTWIVIVGVVQDSLNDGLSKPIKPAVYVPYTLLLQGGMQILVRSDVAPLTLLHAVQLQLTVVNPDQQTYSWVEDLETWISDGPEWQQGHLAAWIFSVFAWLALALAAVGLYSVVTYTVAQRTKEFGIRMALGAQGRDVLRIVFGSAVVSVGGGIVAGLVMSVALNSVMGKWVEGNARDPVILLVGVGLMVVVAGVACLIPARSAAGVDPMVALRCE